MKTIGVLVLAMFLMFAFGSQAFAEGTAGNGTGAMGRTNGTVTDDVGTRGLGAPGVRNGDLDLDADFDRDRGVGTRGTGVGTGTRGYTTNNVRTNAAGDANNGWGWLGILGLLGLAGMFGRNRNPER